MDPVQRKFITEHIQIKVREHINGLEKQKRKFPTVSSYFFSTLKKENSTQSRSEVLSNIPEDYHQELSRVKLFNNSINQKVITLKLQLDGIEFKVQLASDETLTSVMNEVDDVENLSLMSAKINPLN